MRSNPRYKLGRISFFSFFFMVVANCNASCYWLREHIVANSSSCCIFIRIQGCIYLNMAGGPCGFDTFSRDAQTLHLSRNVSKFYAGQVVSLINEQPNQNLLLKVGPLWTIRNNELLIAKAKGEELETSAVRVSVSNTSLPRLKRRYTRYVFLFLVFRWL